MRWPRLVAPFAASTAVSARIDAEGVDEDGAPVAGASWEGAGSWQDTARRTFARDRVEVEATGTFYADGDILPGVARITGGTLTVFGEPRKVVAGQKARNPDGTVNYTRLEVR